MDHIDDLKITQSGLQYHQTVADALLAMPLHTDDSRGRFDVPLAPSPGDWARQAQTFQMKEVKSLA